MSGTNTDSVIWVVGETVGINGSGGTAAVPVGPINFATNTTVPTAAPFGHDTHVTSDGDVYYWNAAEAEWTGPYSLAT